MAVETQPGVARIMAEIDNITSDLVKMNEQIEFKRQQVRLLKLELGRICRHEWECKPTLGTPYEEREYFCKHCKMNRVCVNFANWSTNYKEGKN